MRILITGFDPFGGEKINPSYEAIKNLPDEIEGHSIIRKEIPTVFYESLDVMIRYIEEYQPDIVINIGQAGGREGITIERKAYNLIDARIKDNKGNQPKGIKISENDPDILYSALPIDKILAETDKKNLPVSVSEDAGRFVCNYIMYSMLTLNKKYNLISGFIHVPYCTEQIEEKTENTFSMSLSEMTYAIEQIIKSIIH